MEQEINRLTNRHIGKLFQHLESENIFLSDREKEVIKAQMRFLQNDIIKNVSDMYGKPKE